MSWESFCHGVDRVFNHKQWEKDEKIMLLRKSTNDAHDENMYGIQSNEKLNIEAVKNGKYLQNGFSLSSSSSKASDITKDIKQ